MEALIIVAILAWGVFWIYTLIDIGRRPDSVYQQAGQFKLLWFGAVLIFQFFGTIAYYVIGRPKVLEAERATSQS